MSGPALADILRVDAPYRREVLLQEAVFESGMRLMRVRIREGHRFTLLDLDEATAETLANAMLDWVEKRRGETASEAGGIDGGSAIA